MNLSDRSKIDTLAHIYMTIHFCRSLFVLFFYFVFCHSVDYPPLVSGAVVVVIVW